MPGLRGQVADVPGAADGAADPDALDLEAAARLRMAVGRLWRRLSHGSAEGLTPGQASALATVVRHGPVRLADLAVREAVSPSTLSRIVGRLEAGGYVHRSVEPADRRSAAVEATAAGRRALTRVRTARTALLLARIDALTPEQRDALLAAIPALEALVDLPAPGGGGADR